MHVTTGRHADASSATTSPSATTSCCTAARVGNRCLIGIGAIVLDRCVIGDDCLDRRRRAADARARRSPPASSCSAARRRSSGRSPTRNAPTSRSRRANYVANAARYRAQGI